jgi:hypothetical protein
MFKRRVLPLNEERLRLLDKALTRTNPPPLQDIVTAFIGPPLRLGFEDSSNARAHVVMQFLGRAFAMPGETTFLASYYEPLRSRFIGALTLALPRLAFDELLWRYNLMVGSLVYAMGGAERMVRPPLELPGETIRGQFAAGEAVDLMATFLVGGFLASGRLRSD